MQECIFCQIAAGRGRASVVYEDAWTVAFMDIHQEQPGHVLVIPREHYATVFDVPLELAGRCMETTARVARGLRAALAPQALNVWQSNGSAAGQEVWHFHIHLLPRTLGDGVLRYAPRRREPSPREELDELARRIAAQVEA